MSGWLLDTNVLIDLIFAKSRSIDERFSKAILLGSPLYLSTISLFEFRFGAERSKRRAFQLASLEGLLGRVALASFDAADAERTALLKSALTQQGRVIGGYDLMIAGQASARGWTVVTGNTREFARIDGLQIEDWSVDV